MFGNSFKVLFFIVVFCFQGASGKLAGFDDFSGLGLQRVILKNDLNPAKTQVAFITIANQTVVIRQKESKQWYLVDLKNGHTAKILNSSYFDSVVSHALIPEGIPSGKISLKSFSEDAIKLLKIVSRPLLAEEISVWAQLYDDDTGLALQLRDKATAPVCIGNVWVDGSTYTRTFSMESVEKTAAGNTHFLSEFGKSVASKANGLGRIASLGERGYAFSTASEPGRLRFQCLILEETNSWKTGVERELFSIDEFRLMVKGKLGRKSEFAALFKIPVAEIATAERWPKLLSECGFANGSWREIVRQHPAILLMKRDID